VRIKVIKSGLFATIQDAGRIGYRKEGMVVSGAMDKTALRTANLLIGNDEYEACVEMALIGPTLLFEEKSLICLTGADVSAKVNGKRIKMYRPVLIRSGSILELGHLKNGSFSYLAVYKGFDLPAVMGSKSTWTRGKIGGIEGRTLLEGDYIKLNDNLDLPDLPSGNDFWEAPYGLPHEVQTEPIAIRFIKGPEYDLFDENSIHNFVRTTFTVSSNADRMGYHLTGEKLSLKEPCEMLSSAVSHGTVQVPSSGMPLVLMADHQTTGGYPRIAQIISVDLPALAQAKPGKKLVFQEVSLKEAQRLIIEQEKEIIKLKAILKLRNEEFQNRFKL
jgi:antagonist of KipI